MSVEIRFYDPEPGVDLKKIRAVTGYLQTLIDALSGGQAESWEATQLELGSLSLAARPVSHSVDHVPLQLVEGLADIARRAELPRQWDSVAARAAGRLIDATSRAARIEAVRDGEPIRVTPLDDAARTGLARAMRVTHTSFGALLGHLKGLNDGLRRPTATLVLLDRAEVAVDYDDKFVEQIRAAWRHHRVELTGDISERADGTPTRIAVLAVEILPEESVLTRADMAGGFYPGITGGLTAAEHVRALRGTA